jgi:hypothetical protein
MFVPLGFLYRLTRDPRGDSRALRPLLAGLLFSAAIESAQLLLPSRFSSPLDVLTNGLGAWLGAWAHDAITQRIRLTPALVGALALELPLMGLIYLLIPLLWLSGLAAGDEFARLGLSLILGLIGSVVLGAIHRNRFALTGVISVRRFSLIAAAWYLIGAIPSLMYRPLAIAGAGTIVGLATALWAGAWAREELEGDRRFELETLRRLAPLLLLYLICLGGWPPWAAFAGWHGEWGLGSLWGATDTRQILRTLEHLAAFTVLGYAVAESRGRREQRFRASAGMVALSAGVVATALELVAAGHPGPGASLVRAVLATVTALYGAGLYHLQRAHIRWLLQGESGRRPMPPVADPSRGLPARTERSGVPA